VSEQETLSLLTEQESAQTFDAFLLPPPLFFLLSLPLIIV